MCHEVVDGQLDNLVLQDLFQHLQHQLVVQRVRVVEIVDAFCGRFPVNESNWLSRIDEPEATSSRTPRINFIYLSSSFSTL